MIPFSFTHLTMEDGMSMESGASGESLGSLAARAREVGEPDPSRSGPTAWMGPCNRLAQTNASGRETALRDRVFPG